MMKFEHIGIYARDPQSLAEWYCRVFNLAVVRTLVKAGRPPIYFLKGEEGVVIEILPTSEPGPDRKLPDAGLSHIGIEVDNHPEMVSHLGTLGVPVYDVRDTSQGWTIGYLKDPEGNVLEIVAR
ncbi:MAG: VOC family protein [Anaerolineales bacterium]|nr:VOC family protein [Anaerolineales bacterium]